MSTLKTVKCQLGVSGTATQNFTLTAEAANGTMKLARGNAGATTQDILTVDAAGLMSAVQQPTTGNRSAQLATMQKFADEFGASLTTNGYQRLPSGVIIQWGNNTTVSGSVNFTFPIAFPNATRAMVVTPNTGLTVSMIASSLTNTNAVITSVNSSTGANISVGFTWMAIGY